MVKEDFVLKGRCCNLGIFSGYCLGPSLFHTCPCEKWIVNLNILIVVVIRHLT